MFLLKLVDYYDEMKELILCTTLPQTFCEFKKETRILLLIKNDSFHSNERLVADVVNSGIIFSSLPFDACFILKLRFFAPFPETEEGKNV